MEKTGLSAFAESFALDRAELHRLKLLNHRLFEHLCKEVGHLSGAATKVNDLGFKVEDYKDFSSGLWPHGLGVTIELEHHPVAILGIQQELAHALLWGKEALAGKLETGQAEPRPITRIEARVLADTVGGALVRAFDEAFRPLFGTGAGLSRTDNNGNLPAVAGALKGRGRLATATVECSVGEVRGSLSFSLLLSVLLPVRSRLTWGANERLAVVAAAKAPPVSVLGANLELEAVLGNLSMPLSAVGSLKPGAVIPLGRLGDKAPRLELRYGRQTLFYGTVVEDQGWRKFLIEEKGFNRGGSRSEYLH